MAGVGWRNAAGYCRSWMAVLVYALVLLCGIPRSSLQFWLSWSYVAPPGYSMALAQQAGPPSSAMPSSPPAITSSTPLSPLPDPDIDMKAFVEGISDRVIRIGLKARENHENACGTLGKCANQTLPCLRSDCGYQKNENFNCTAGFDFNHSLCSPPGDSIVGEERCSRVLLNYEEPFLRLPPQEYPAPAIAANSTTNPLNQTDHACIHSPLRETLVSSLDMEGYLRAGSVYFGSIAGTFISFPGMNLFERPSDSSRRHNFPFDCEDYDPRHRPWFAEASSPKKQVSVLVDLTNGMDFNILNDVFRSKSRIELVQSTLYGLEKTFRESDSVALTTNPALPAGIETKLVKVLGIDDPKRCVDFKASVFRLAEDSSSADLTDGIKRALTKFGNVDGNETEMILLVFTRGMINVETAKDAINAHNAEKRKIHRVFLYGVDITASEQATFNNLTQVAENVSGVARNMRNDDPLLAIYSYFDFLGRLCANVPSPFWANEYKDISFLGNVTTHIKPVYDSQGHFIGVAAMDVRKPKDPSRFEAARRQNLSVKPFIPASLKDTLNLPNCTSATECYDGFPDILCDSATSPAIETVVCPRTSHDARKCCEPCYVPPSEPSRPKSSPPPSPPPGPNGGGLWVKVGPALAGAFVLAAAGFFIFYKYRGKRPPETTRPTLVFMKDFPAKN